MERQQSQVQFANIPDLLKAKPRWVCADRVKAPIQCNGWYARSTQASTWTTFERAKAAYEVYQQYGGHPEIHGIGFVCDDSDDVVGIDLDKIDLDGRGERAAEIQNRFSATYQERSPSGRGVRIWVRGKLPFPGRNRKDIGIEVYQSLHYLTTTGNRLNDRDIVEDQDALDWLVQEYFSNWRSMERGERRDYETEVGEALADEIRDHLRGRPGTTKGRDASGACMRVISDVVHGFELDADDAVPFLAEWGERDDQLDEHGRYYPWDEKEIVHKITDAIKSGTKESGKLLPGWWYDLQYGDAIASMVKPGGGVVVKVPAAKTDEFDPEKYKTAPAARKRRGYKLGELRGLPRPKYLIKKHLSTNSFAILYGPSGAGKSFIGVEMAMAIATGRPYLGHYESRQGAVVYLSGEGNGGIENRFRAYCQHHDIPEPDNLVVIPYRFDLLTDKEIDEIVETIRIDLDGQPPAVIFVDTVARFFGCGDENSPKDMGGFVRACDVIRERTGATIVPVAHTGKDLSKGPRGHNSLFAAADTMIMVDESGKDGSMVDCTKQKDDAEFAPYIVKRKVVVLGTDEDGEEISSCVCVAQDQLRTAYQLLPKARKEQLRNLYHTFKAKNFTAAEAEEPMGLKRTAVFDALKELTRKGFLTANPGTYLVNHYAGNMLANC
jgi:putative DNA primase/helicase